MGSMEGKTCVLTGATSGIGREAALELARQGARLVLTTRDDAKAKAVEADLRAAAPDVKVEWVRADLSLMREVRKAAAEIRARVDRIDVLVNNAGAIYTDRDVTAEGIERTFATNHLSYFLLTRELQDLLVQSAKTAPVRIVNVASDAHRRGKMNWSDLQAERVYLSYAVYAQSKLANILFTRELAKRLKGTGVTANCLHPGVVATGFGLNTPGLFQLGVKLLSPLFISAKKGSETTVYLATSPEVEGKTGGYYAKQREKKPSRKARDDAAAARLWAESERLLAQVGV